MSQVIQKFNFFLDTERNLKGECRGDRIQLNMSQTNISVNDEQFIRLVLKNFSMMKTWTDINSNNNKFRIKTPLTSGAYNSVSLTAKNYSSIKTLAEEFANKINTALIDLTHYASGTITINNPTGTDIDADTDNIIDFTITTNAAHSLTDGDVSIQFRISDGDIYAILGGDRISDDTSTDASITMTAPTTSVFNMLDEGVKSEPIGKLISYFGDSHLFW